MSPPLRRVLSLIAAALLAAALAPAAAAQQLAPGGALLAVAGKQVPLPGGGWRIVGSQDGTGGALSTIVLVRGDGARGDGVRIADLAVVRVNARPRSAIFGSTRECGRDDIYFAAIRYDTASDGYCHFGNLVLPDWNGVPSPLAEAVLGLRRAGFLLPAAVMQVGARARSREHVIDVRYYFSPPPIDAPPVAVPDARRGRLVSTGAAAAPGAAWPTHPLSPTRLESAPQLRARAAQLAAWADLLQGELERGLRGRIDAAAAPLPSPWDTTAVAARRIAQARGALDALLAAGEIDAATYDAAVAAIEAGMLEPETQGMSLWVRSLYKLATYRLASIVDGLIVGGFFMDLSQSAITVAIGMVIRPVTVYVNEILWAGSGVGRPAASLLPVDFAEIGANRAR